MQYSRVLDPRLPPYRGRGLSRAPARVSARAGACRLVAHHLLLALISRHPPIDLWVLPIPVEPAARGRPRTFHTLGERQADAMAAFHPCLRPPVAVCKTTPGQHRFHL